MKNKKEIEKSSKDLKKQNKALKNEKIEQLTREYKKSIYDDINEVITNCNNIFNQTINVTNLLEIQIEDIDYILTINDCENLERPLFFAIEGLYGNYKEIENQIEYLQNFRENLLTVNSIVYQSMASIYEKHYNKLKAECEVMKKEKIKWYSNVFQTINNTMVIYIRELTNVIIDFLDEKDYVWDSLENSILNFNDYINNLIIKYKKLTNVECEIKFNNKYKNRLRCSYEQIFNFAQHNNYEKNRQNGTSHSIWKHKYNGNSLTLPNKTGTIPQGTMLSILKQMKLNRNDLTKFLYN